MTAATTQGDGRANAAAVPLFVLPREAVSTVSGHGGRDKIVEPAGVGRTRKDGRS